MRGSLIAVAFFAVGVVCGRLDVLPGAIAAGGVSLVTWARSPSCAG